MAATDLFPLEADYALAQPWSAGIVRAVAESGRQLARLKRAPQRVFRLVFRQRPTSEKLQLEDWYRRFERDFFNWRHAVWQVKPDGSYLERYFAVEFAGPPQIELVANEAHDMEVALVEAVGRALFAYPDPAMGHPAAFQEEDATSKTQGTWSLVADATAHGGNEKQNTNLNTTDFALWVYAGYGFRLWARNGPDLGIFEVLLDDTSLGNVDLYAAAAAGAQPVFTKLDVPLGVHRIKLRATNTKNAAATGQIILADALEYLI
ncbi:MAG: hypothetical protein ACE5H2_08505 [Terriglobia bacterium]